eukprot:514944_1
MLSHLNLSATLIIMAFLVGTNQSVDVDTRIEMEMKALLQSNQTDYRTRESESTLSLQPELIGLTGEFLNHSDIHSLGLSSKRMHVNKRLLTNPNYRYLNRKRSFYRLLNITVIRSFNRESNVTTVTRCDPPFITMDDLKLIPRTEPLIINHAELFTFMQTNKNKSSIFMGIMAPNNLNWTQQKPFIAFNLRPVEKDSNDTTHFIFVFGDSSDLSDDKYTVDSVLVLPPYLVAEGGVLSLSYPERLLITMCEINKSWIHNN